MSWHKPLTNLHQIPLGNYQGYLWVSDKENPEIVTSILADKYEKNELPQNPFIREAFMYDKDKQISISIRHVPGKYLINMFDIKQLPDNCETKVQAFLAHEKLPGKLHFKEIWLPEKDENCEDFEVLKKKAIVFAGFEKEEN